METELNGRTESAMHPKLTVRSLAGIALCLTACGVTNAAPSEESPGAVDHEPTATFEPTELQALSATPKIAACEESAQCVRDAAGKDDPAATCRDAAARCLRALSERTSPALGRLSECRESARICLANDGERASCSEEFRACVKGSIERDTR